MGRKFLRLGALLLTLGFLALFLWNPTYSDDGVAQLLWKSVVLHGIGILIFALLLKQTGHHQWRSPNPKGLLLTLPALLVAINNFPILAVASGKVTLARPDLLPLFLLDCLSIGAFEELAFRGTLFLMLLEKRHVSKKQIFFVTVLSSGVFGAFHLSNLLDGAGFGATVLQVGYSFLIGGMCAIVLLKTGNLLLAVLLHTVYDIGGGFVNSGVAVGTLWDTPTVVITAVLGVLSCGWLLWVLSKVSPEDVDAFY